MGGGPKFHVYVYICLYISVYVRDYIVEDYIFRDYIFRDCKNVQGRREGARYRIDRDIAMSPLLKSTHENRAFFQQRCGQIRVPTNRGPPRVVR